ncbi:MAG: STT3 domain-containing protein [Candidatus Omnitrophica bacterium]|nr:STT3 domain-containing protein [Candidatus Omnitrophota bacterium]
MKISGQRAFLKPLLGTAVLLAVLGANVYIRSYPVAFPQLMPQARQAVLEKLGIDAASIIQKMYPGYHPLIQERFTKKFITEAIVRPDFRNRVQKKFDEMRSAYRDERGRSFFLEIDPWYRVRLTRFVLENGYPGDKRVDGKVYDTYVTAPDGWEVTPHRLLYYLSAWLYKACSKAVSGVTPERFLFYLPLVFAGVFLMILYFFCRRFFSPFVGILAVIFTGLTPIVVMRSAAGWFDTDMLNVIFPLCTIWCVAEAVRSRRIAGNIVFTLLAAFFTALFAYTWLGWWFIVVIITAFYAWKILDVFNNCREKSGLSFKEAVPYAVSCVAYLLASAVFCRWIAGISFFGLLISSVKENLLLGGSQTASIWPLIEYTVNELRAVDMGTLGAFFCDSLYLEISFIGVLWIYLTRKKNGAEAPVLLTAFWMFFMFYAMTKAVRFAFFFAVPFGIFLGVFFDEVRIRGLSFVRERVRGYGKAFFYALIGCLIIIPALYFGAFGIRETGPNLHPLLEKKNYEVFTGKIPACTPGNAVVNAFWDVGHWIKELSGRRTIIDPQTQNRPATYWVAKALMTGNEEETVRILRMLNNSSRDILEEIDPWVGDRFRTIALIRDLLECKAEDADRILGGYPFPDDMKQYIKDRIYFKEPSAPVYFLGYGPMKDELREVSFLANWDFAKLYAKRSLGQPPGDVIEGLRGTFGLDDAKARNIYEECASIATKSEANEALSRRDAILFAFNDGYEDGGMVYFPSGVVFDTRTFSVRAMKDGKLVRFSRVRYYDKGRYEAKDFPDAKVAAVAVIHTDKGWQCVAMTTDAVFDSFFFKILFLKGQGLSSFEPVMCDDDAAMYLYKINWPREVVHGQRDRDKVQG